MKQADIEFAIVGAGFGGIIAAMQLNKNGYHNYRVFEKATMLGGTWRDNIYPGCACDVSSYLYSIKDAPNPNWTKIYSSQGEILAYLKDVSVRNKIEEKIIYNSEILHVEFDTDNLYWILKDQQENIYTAKYVFLAQGPLNRPVKPAFKGLENFKGDCFHTAEWNTQCDLKGKKVAVIGTGASAIQVIPNIVDQVKELKVLQRTAAWVLPRANPMVSDTTKKIFNSFPFLEMLQREYIFWTNELFGLAFVGNDFVNNIVSKFALSYLKKKIPNDALRQKLTPTYKLGCKRILVSKSYLPTFNKDNVSLYTQAIQEIKEHYIVFENGEEIEVDIIILATGFEAAEIQVKTKLIGTDKINLVEKWKQEGVRAFKGSVTQHLPNLFFVLGPNTGLGHNSVLHIMESQMKYIFQYIKASKKLAANQYLDVNSVAEKKYNEELQKKFAGTVWTSGCKSWYLNSKGVNTTIFPRLNTRFRWEMKKFDMASFDIKSI